MPEPRYELLDRVIWSPSMAPADEQHATVVGLRQNEPGGTVMVLLKLDDDWSTTGSLWVFPRNLRHAPEIEIQLTVRVDKKRWTDYDMLYVETVHAGITAQIDQQLEGK